MALRTRTPSPRSSNSTKKKSASKAANGRKTSSDMGAALSEIVTSSPAPKRPAPKRIYDVGPLRIPLERADNMRGKRGESARRYKEILDRMSSVPRKTLSDPDRFDPPRREARPDIERSPGRTSWGEADECRSDDDDDDGY